MVEPNVFRRLLQQRLVAGSEALGVVQHFLEGFSNHIADVEKFRVALAPVGHSEGAGLAI